MLAQRKTCLTLIGGSWSKSHDLIYERYRSFSWESEAGMMVMGGYTDTTELLLSNGLSEEKFKLKYGVQM